HDQVIMATATIPNPQLLAKRLLGRDAWVVGPEMDSSPQYPREVVLIQTRDGHRRNVMRSLLSELAPRKDTGSILSFIDSRTGADEIAGDVNKYLSKLQSEFTFATHRSVQTNDYRIDIEQKVKAGEKHLKGLVATPTLDVGIDMPGIRTLA